MMAQPTATPLNTIAVIGPRSIYLCALEHMDKAIAKAGCEVARPHLMNVVTVVVVVMVGLRRCN